MTGGSRLVPPGTRVVTRRELLDLTLRTAGAAALTPALLGLCCRRAVAQAAGAKSGGKKLILLWLEGGPSQLDTFDPKPGAPTQGPMGVLPTEIPGWSVADALPGFAARAHHCSVIRTLTSKEASHSRAREMLHTGYSPNPAVHYPTLGSIVAHEVGDLEHELPAFVQIDGPLANKSYLGIEAAPFRIEDPTGEIANVAPPPGVTKEAIAARTELHSLLEDRFARTRDPGAVHANEVQRNRAWRMMNSSLLDGFRLDAEKNALREAYGSNKFGQGVLLARRLVERGVSAVEVVLDGWDTHNDNYPRTKALCEILDPALSTLLDDLRERELLDDTLVLCMGEFGRTPQLRSNNGRGHWPNNFCAVLAGGGLTPGKVVGITDEIGENIVERPVQVADLFATVAKALGIRGDKSFATESRSVELVDPAGVPVAELLSG